MHFNVVPCRTGPGLTHICIYILLFQEIGGIVNPAFSTASIPEEVEGIFGPLKMSVQVSGLLGR